MVLATFFNKYFCMGGYRDPGIPKASNPGIRDNAIPGSRDPDPGIISPMHNVLILCRGSNNNLQSWRRYARGSLMLMTLRLKRCSEGYRATPPGWFSWSCRRYLRWQRILVILSEEIFFDGMLLRFALRLTTGRSPKLYDP